MKRLKLQSIIILKVGLIMILCMSLFVVYASYEFKTTLKRARYEIMESYLQNVVNETDNFFQELNKISLLLFYKQEIISGCKEYGSMTKDERYRFIEVLRQTVLEMSSLTDNINLIELYDQEHNNIYSHRYHEYIFNGEMESKLKYDQKSIDAILNKIDEKESGSLMIGLVEPLKNKSNKQRRFFYAGRKLYSFSPREDVGYICFVYPTDNLRAFFDYDHSISNVFVLDSSDQVIFDFSGEWIGKDIEEYSPEIKNVFLPDHQTYYKLKRDKASMLAAGKVCAQNGLKIIAVQDEKEVFAVTDQMIRVLVLAFLCLLMVTFVMVSRMILRVTKPLDTMTVYLKDIDLDDPKNMLCVDITCREVEELAQAYDFMIQKIQHMLDQEYKSVIREQEYQLALVRSKIHPHFLYNTLDTIRMSAVVNQDEKTADMILALSDFFRKSIIADKVVLLEDEFAQARSYISLLKIRYERLETELFLDEDLRFLEFPSFVIQPLIENAFLHGIKPKGYAGKITVLAKTVGKGRYLVTVCDDGVGISDEKLSAVEHDIEELRKGNLNLSASHIGLLSVCRQIIHFFGEHGEITVENMRGTGFCIRIVITDSTLGDLSVL